MTAPPPPPPPAIDPPAPAPATSSSAEQKTQPSTGEAVLAAIGTPFVVVADQVRSIWRIARLTLLYTLTGRKDVREIFAQAYEIGNRSAFFIACVAGSLGMTLVYQSGLQALRITGDLTLMGAFYLQVLLREFGPTITAMMVATRVGTGIAAEIGSMVVTEQVDALRMSGAHPVNYLIVPRFIAATVMGLVLTIFSILVSYLAGLATAIVAFGVSPYTFVNLSLVGWPDLIMMLLKSFAYGVTIPIVAGASGLDAHGGSEGVGWATTQSVVNCSMAVVLLDFLLSGFGYVFLLR